MIYNFAEYIVEALRLTNDKPDDPGLPERQQNHYLFKRRKRLLGLEIDKFVDTNNKEVKLDDAQNKIATNFFRKVYFEIANPNGKIFNTVNIKANNFGIVYLGDPSIIIENETEIKPIFKVDRGYHKDTGKHMGWAKGSHFWISTDEDAVLTIKLETTNGANKSGKRDLMYSAKAHIENDRNASLSIKKSKSDPGTTTKELIHIVSDPIQQRSVVLDLSSDIDPAKQASSIIENSRVVKVEAPVAPRVSMRAIISADDRAEVERESRKFQVDMTPGRVFILSFNDRAGVLSAQPIIKSKLDTSRVLLGLGGKNLYWINRTDPSGKPIESFGSTNPNFVINRGDKISFAKRLGGGSWAKYTGTVDGISADTRNSPYPFIKSNSGWNVSILDPAEHNIAEIFKTKIVESIITDFSYWKLIND
jgi:hypothetical protein